MFQVMTARQAADLIHDGDCIAFNGQVRFALAEKFISALDVDTVDLGVPMLSLHAPFELISKIDLYSTYRAFLAFAKK